MQAIMDWLQAKDYRGIKNKGGVAESEGGARERDRSIDR